MKEHGLIHVSITLDVRDVLDGLADCGGKVGAEYYLTGLGEHSAGRIDGPAPVPGWLG